MNRLISSLADLLTGAPATNHRPLFHVTRGWQTVAGDVYDVRSYADMSTATDSASVTENTVGVTRAIAAAKAGGGGTIRIPDMYNVNALTVDDQGITLEGIGRRRSGLKCATGDLLTLASAHKFSARHLTLQSLSGGGHVIAVSTSLAHALFEDLNLYQANDAKSYYWHEGDDYIDNLWRHIDAEHTLTATISGWHIKSTAANRNKWSDIRPTYSGAYVWEIETTSASSYASNGVIEDITGEVNNGGLISLKGCRNWRLADIGIYDLGTTTVDLINLDDAASGIQTFDITLDNVTRHGGTLGVGLYDLDCDTGSNASPDIRVNGCGGATPFAINARAKRISVRGGRFTITRDDLAVIDGFGGKRTRYYEVTADYALTTADSDTVWADNKGSATTTFTLPATARGLTYTFLCKNAAGEINVNPNAADKIMGKGITALDDKDYINTGGTNAVGDLLRVVGDGVDGWWVIEERGTWARET